MKQQYVNDTTLTHGRKVEVNGDCFRLHIWKINELAPKLCLKGITRVIAV